jgi:hypothetical protein
LLTYSVDSSLTCAFVLILDQGLQQFGSDFAMIQQLLPDKTRQQVRAKFKTEEKKNPLLVHDAIIHRSGVILLNSGQPMFFFLTFDLA